MEIELPKDLKVSNKSIGSIISIGLIIAIATSLFSFFKLDKLDVPYKIIVIISIFLFIAIVDIFILYIRDREKQYKVACLQFLLDTLKKNIKIIDNEIVDIRKENQEIIKNIEKLNSEK